jgi:type IV pilus assembly protein PilB
MSESPPVLLGDILQRLQLVDEEQVKEALEHQKASGRLFGESLLDLGFIAEDDLSWALSSQLDLPFVAVTPDMVDTDLLKAYPVGFLRRSLVLPLVASSTTLSVVLADPTDEGTLARLERMSGLELSVAVGTPSALRDTLNTLLGPPKGEAELAPVPGRAPSLNSPALAELLDRALRRGAVFVHLDQEKEGPRLRYRTANGTLIDEDDFDIPTFEEISRGLSNCLGPGEEPAPGIHTWKDRNASLDLPFRAEAVAGAHGMCLTLALDHSAYQVRSAPALDDGQWKQLDAILKRPCGLVVGTSPDVSGRTLFLSRALKGRDAERRRCCAMVPEGVSLPPGAIRFGSTPTAAAMAALSQMEGFDLVAGSLPDLDAVPALVEAGARDRMVVAGLPGQSALGLLMRMLDTGVSSTLLSEALLAVVALREIRDPGADTSVVLTEVLPVDEPLQRALQNGGSIEALREAAREQGFQEMAVRARALDTVSREALEDLERHRYLKEAA